MRTYGRHIRCAVFTRSDQWVGCSGRRRSSVSAMDAGGRPAGWFGVAPRGAIRRQKLLNRSGALSQPTRSGSEVLDAVEDGQDGP
jgi:hypothetical protein